MGSDSIPPKLPDLSEYVTPGALEEVQRKLEAFQSEMIAWQQQVEEQNEAWIQQQNEMAIEASMHWKESLERMENLEDKLKMEKEMEKAMKKQEITERLQMQEQMLQRRQQELMQIQEMKAIELEEKMQAMQSSMQNRQLELEQLASQMNNLELNVERRKEMHQAIFEFLKTEGVVNEQENMSINMDERGVEVNGEILSKRLTERCLEIMNEFGFNREDGNWTLPKQK